MLNSSPVVSCARIIERMSSKWGIKNDQCPSAEAAASLDVDASAEWRVRGRVDFW